MAPPALGSLSTAIDGNSSLPRTTSWRNARWLSSTGGSGLSRKPRVRDPSPPEENRHGRQENPARLFTPSAEDHQALLRQSGRAETPAARGAGRRALPRRGQEEGEALGAGGCNDGEARRAQVAHRTPHDAAEPGAARRAGEGAGSQ